MQLRVKFELDASVMHPKGEASSTSMLLLNKARPLPAS